MAEQLLCNEHVTVKSMGSCQLLTLKIFDLELSKLNIHTLPAAHCDRIKFNCKITRMSGDE